MFSSDMNMNTTNFLTGSVVSYPERGNFGRADYRGNCTGYLIKDIINFFKPKLFLDINEGSGTSRDVCRALGIDYIGLDLHSGTDFTKDYIRNKINKQADVSFSHAPYHDIIKYSNSVWNKGKGIIEGDTSHCKSEDEFIYKSQVMLMNQREATKDGGVYCTLIGDIKKAGKLSSYQSDFIQLMPKSELLNVIIKLQHNTFSERKSYAGNFCPITHEYLILWKKKAVSLFNIGLEIATNNSKNIGATWRSIIRIVMMKLQRATLNEIYEEVEKTAKDLINNNPNWKAKIRQKLQVHHTRVERGIWSI